MKWCIKISFCTKNNINLPFNNIIRCVSETKTREISSSVTGKLIEAIAKIRTIKCYDKCDIKGANKHSLYKNKMSICESQHKGMRMTKKTNKNPLHFVSKNDNWFAWILSTFCWNARSITECVVLNLDVLHPEEELWLHNTDTIEVHLQLPPHPVLSFGHNFTWC